MVDGKGVMAQEASIRVACGLLFSTIDAVMLIRGHLVT
jgi:hypothetical protein